MSYGEMAYTAYVRHVSRDFASRGVPSGQGRELPDWADLGALIQGAWEAAAWAALGKYTEGLADG